METYQQEVASSGSWRDELLSWGGWYKVGKPVSQGVVDALHGRDSGLSDLWIRHRVRPTVGLEHAVLQGDGILVSAENAVMGVAIAVISFVGSMGNVPFAVALWGGGVSFAGVIAFVYADLITVPVLNVYRKYYGWSVMLYILGVFFVTMAFTGFLMEQLFSVLGSSPISLVA